MAGKTRDERKQVRERVIIALAERGNRSFGQVSEALSMDARTLYTYRKDPEIQKAVQEKSLENLRAEIPPVLAALVGKAKKGESRSIETFLKMTGLLVEKQEVTTKTDEGDKYAKMSDDDIQRQLDEIKQAQGLHVVNGGKKEAWANPPETKTQFGLN